MRFLDLSQPLFDGAPNCPAHPPISIRTAPHADGGNDSWQMEFWNFASHSGSHLDAPRHKIAGGATIDQIPLERFAGRAFLADLRALSPAAPIGQAELASLLPADLCDAIVLLATGWGQKRAKTDEWLHQSPFLSSEGAQFLVDRGVRGVGIDHFSIGGSQEPRNAQIHTILLGAGIWVLEELRFAPEVFALLWSQTLLALPLNTLGASGAPCRPVLLLRGICFHLNISFG